MSLDINWSLLSAPDGSSNGNGNVNAEAGPSKLSPSLTATGNHVNDDPMHPSAETLTNHLISVLNTQLASTNRPSFIGPIEITNFDFGSTAPEVEIKDIRDVWRAFDEDDDDDDDEDEEDGDGRYEGEEEVLRDDSEHERDGQGYGYDSRRASGRSSELYQQHQQYPQHMGNGHSHSIISPIDESSRLPSADWDDTASVFSSNRRQSVLAVGLGARGLGGLGSPGLGYSHSQANGHGPGPLPSGSGLFSPGLGGVGLGAASVFSHPLSPGGPGSIRYHPPPTQHTYLSHPPSPARTPQIRPPTKTKTQSSSGSSSIPSLQLHLNLTHTSNLTLTLLTSLIVNYPSSIFMSLPLKLSITGLRLAADLIVAFDGERKRIHLTILDEDHESNGLGGHASTPVGQRLLPEMRIDSEIGHSDAHVLRNVGKVERFIADVVRKTLVDELVFPNFHTIAL